MKYIYQLKHSLNNNKDSKYKYMYSPNMTA